MALSQQVLENHDNENNQLDGNHGNHRSQKHNNPLSP